MEINEKATGIQSRITFKASIRGATKLKPLPGAPYRVAVCVEPFRAMICKSFVLRLRDFLVSFLSLGRRFLPRFGLRAVPNLDPKALTKRASPNARDLEDPCHLWVQLQALREIDFMYFCCKRMAGKEIFCIIVHLFAS